MSRKSCTGKSPLAVSCPICHATPIRACVTADGRKTRPHKARREALAELGRPLRNTVQHAPYLPVTQARIAVTLTDEVWLFVQQAAERDAPFLNAADNRRLLRGAARTIYRARLKARGGTQS